MSDPLSYSPVPEAKKSRKGLVIGAGVAVAAVLVGGGAFAVSQLSGGGAQPTAVLPDSTLAFASVDLDPGAAQKIEAFKTLRKFPDLRDEVKNEKRDLRRDIFKAFLEDSDCGGMTYADDIEPWIGDRAAFGAVDLGGDEPSPVVVLSQTDSGKAEDALAQLKKCDGLDGDFGGVVTDDFVVVSDGVANAKKIVAAAEKKPVTDSDGYQEATDAAGDAGIVNYYVSSKAGATLAKVIADKAPSGAISESQLDGLAKGLGSIAGSVRFADGGVEVSTVMKSKKTQAPKGAGEAAGKLPKDSAAVLALKLPAQVLDELSAPLADLGVDKNAVKTVFGEGVVVAVGGDDFREPKVGVAVRGDADKIKSTLAEVLQGFGLGLDGLPVKERTSGDRYVLATSSDYADELLKDGRLGDLDSYKAVIPEGDKSTSVLFANFDSGLREMIVSLVKSDNGPSTEVDRNLDPLDALGISAWNDGDYTHSLLKVTTD